MTEDVADCESNYFHILTVLNEAIKGKSTPNAEANAVHNTKLPTIHIPTFTDTYTSRAYQLERGNESDPTIKELLLFLEKRALALENEELPPRLTTSQW